MASFDPLLGQKDAWRHDEIVNDGVKPVLYHCDASYYSQIVRLALTEKRVEYHSRHITLVESKENLDSFFLKLNPKGEVPVLVHGDKVTTGTVNIVKYIDDKFEGPKLKLSDARVEKFIALHEAIDVNKLISGFYVKHNAVGKVVVPKDIEHGIRKLKALVEEEKDGAIKAAAEAKLKAYEELKKQYEESSAELYEDQHKKLLAALDELEKELSGENREGKFIAGSDISIADVLFSVLLARLHFASELAKDVSERPKVHEYWLAVKERPAFKQADIWDHLRTGLVAHLLSETLRDGVVDGFVITGAFLNEHVAVPVIKAGHATGEFLHKKVIEPVVESPTYKAMSFAVGHAAHQAGEFWNDKVTKPVTESDAFKEISKKTEEGTHSFFESVKHAGAYVAEKSSEAAAAVSEQAHKASEYVQKAASGREENGHEGETEEERKKRMEAHKEAHEKAAEEGKK